MISEDAQLVIMGAFSIILIAILAISIYMGRNELIGLYTNGKTENCISYESIEFAENRFMSIKNVALDSIEASRRHIVTQIGQTADGESFLRIYREGRYIVIDDGDEKIMTKDFKDGGIESSFYSKSGGEIIIGDTTLWRVRFRVKRR